MASYTALQPAFYNGRRLRAGQTFEAPTGFQAKWASPTAEYKANPPVADLPQAMSKVGKQTAQSFTQAMKALAGVKPEVAAKPAKEGKAKPAEAKAKAGDLT